MSERERCPEVIYLGVLKENSSFGERAVRGVCDRAVGHPARSHRGRLLLGSKPSGIYQWLAEKAS